MALLADPVASLDHLGVDLGLLGAPKEGPSSTVEGSEPREPVDIKPGVDVYLIRGRMIGRVLLPARILTDTTACRVRIDATGIGHAVLTTQYELRFYEVFHVQKWKGRW